MNKKLFINVLLAAGASGMATNALAHPAYVEPAKAFTCSDCHVGGTRSKSFVPGIIEAFDIDQTLPIQDKIKAIFALTPEQRLPAFTKIDVLINPKATSPDTAPILKPANTHYNVIVGEKPVTIVFNVKDAESDTYTIVGPGIIPSTPSPYDSATQTSSFSYTWSPEAVYAGLTYPLVASVRENQRSIGRFLPSNVATSSVTVWPARANTKTAKVEQFDLLIAKWSEDTLMLSGKVTFKSKVSAGQQADALSTLKLSVTSAKGAAIGSSPVIAADGAWTWEAPATASQVPCMVVTDFEGLKAKRPVILAPRATCVK